MEGIRRYKGLTKGKPKTVPEAVAPPPAPLLDRVRCSACDSPYSTTEEREEWRKGLCKSCGPGSARFNEVMGSDAAGLTAEDWKRLKVTESGMIDDDIVREVRYSAYGGRTPELIQAEKEVAAIMAEPEKLETPEYDPKSEFDAMPKSEGG